jgi:hypothetical protein
VIVPESGEAPTAPPPAPGVTTPLE